MVVVRTTDERGRAETVLANWARDPHPSEFDHEIGREIDRIDRAIIKGDVRVLMEYGGLQAAMKRSVALSKRARRQAGRGFSSESRPHEPNRPPCVGALHQPSASRMWRA